MNGGVYGEMTLTARYELTFISEDKRDPHPAAERVSEEASGRKVGNVSTAHPQPHSSFDDA